MAEPVDAGLRPPLPKEGPTRSEIPAERFRRDLGLKQNEIDVRLEALKLGDPHQKVTATNETRISRDYLSQNIKDKRATIAERPVEIDDKAYYPFFLQDTGNLANGTAGFLEVEDVKRYFDANPRMRSIDTLKEEIVRRTNISELGDFLTDSPRKSFADRNEPHGGDVLGGNIGARVLLADDSEESITAFADGFKLSIAAAEEAVTKIEVEKRENLDKIIEKVSEKVFATSGTSTQKD